MGERKQRGQETKDSESQLPKIVVDFCYTHKEFLLQTVLKCSTRTMGQVKYRLLYLAKLRVKHIRTEAVLLVKKRLVDVQSSTLDPKRHLVMTAVTGCECTN